jgi:uncharacterized protein (TIGR03435 family)
MTARLPQPLCVLQRALLAAAALATFAAPLTIGLLHPARIHAQEAPRTAAPRIFDVASVKRSKLTFAVTQPERSGGRITWRADLDQLIGYAYHLEPWRLSGDTPDGIFDIEATTSATASTDDIRLMFQSLLHDRFHFGAHRITRETDGWALTIAKNGLKIKPVNDADPPPPMPEWFARFDSAALGMEGQVLATLEGKGVGALTGRRVTMAQVADGLQRPLRTIVVDETGLSGKYYFGIQFARQNAPEDIDRPTIFAALQESLGLRLEKRRLPVEVLVIDHVDKTPTEN